MKEFLMHDLKLTVGTAIAAVGIAAAGSALALSMANLPPERIQGAVTYRSGGIGEAEAAAMRHAESRYPLTLEFVKRARPTDEFLADVQVTIHDPAGNTTLQTVSSGPVLLMKLPNGKYTVTATQNGRSEVRHVTVAANKPERVTFEW
jgi:hypothetical protein